MAAKKTSSHPVRQLSASDRKLVERLRAICMRLPEANERVSHGEPTWFAGKGKVFAMLDNHHHDSPHLSVWLPQPLGMQEQLIDAAPETFFRPPYVGPSGWVAMKLDADPDWTAVEALVRDAYVHVAQKKLLDQLAAGEASMRKAPAKPKALPKQKGPKKTALAKKRG